LVILLYIVGLYAFYLSVRVIYLFICTIKFSN
jgi:hypothetical protein